MAYQIYYLAVANKHFLSNLLFNYSACRTRNTIGTSTVT